MDLSTATEILSLHAERDDLARRIVRTAGWQRVADDEDGTPLYASAPGHDGVALSLAVMLLHARAGTVRRAHEQQRGEQNHVSKPGVVHASTVAPLATPGQVA